MFDFTTSNLLLVACGASALVLLLNSAQAPPGHRGGWAVVALATLALVVAGRHFFPQVAGFVALSWFVVFGVTPGYVARAMTRRLNRGDYDAAWRWARALAWLHPADGYPAQLRLVTAMRRARHGDFNPLESALAALDARRPPSPDDEVFSVLRMLGRWGEIIRRVQDRQQGGEVSLTPRLAVALLRAQLETGRLPEALALFRGMRRALAPVHFESLRRQGCDLALAAFSGRVELTARALDGLSDLPPGTRAAWLATARLASGEPAAAAELRRLRDTEDNAVLRRVIEQRLALADRLLAPPLSAADAALLDDIAREVDQAGLFGGPAAAARRPLATWALLALIVLMFYVEFAGGGIENESTLWRLGAFGADAVRRGQWWRLVAHLFLHFGVAHVSFNGLALLYFGPFVERSLGRLRYLVCYFASGVGAALILTALALVGRHAGPEWAQRLAGPDLMVGASGAIMGLIGATGAILLRGWRTRRSAFLQQRLRGIVMIVVFQVIFDQMFPQIGWSIHLLGLAVGFVTTWFIQPRH